jgi:hypothetical protein
MGCAILPPELCELASVPCDATDAAPVAAVAADRPFASSARANVLSSHLSRSCTRVHS